MIAETGNFQSIERINFMEREERRPEGGAVLIQAVKTFSTKFKGGVMNNKCVSVFAVVLCAVMFSATNIVALNNGLARTPPMGFNTWNWFGCRNSSGHGYVTDTMLFQIANAFISKGMKAVGYQYINIDDCWAGTSRDARGGLYPDPRFFPRGLKWFTDSIHRMGLKVGIYSDIGRLTCASCYGTGGLPGMQPGNEQRDCDSFVAWGFDYLKLDFCCFDFGGGYPNNTAAAIAAYVRAREALKAAPGRMRPKVPDAHDILYSICNWGDYSPWLWGDTIGNLWRTTNDIGWHWTSMLAIVDRNAPLYPYSRIGSWNDPDMLEVGNGDFASNYARNRAHMSLWCIMASALLAGNDIRTMNDSLKNIMTNSEVIAINQDTLGGNTTRGIIQGRRVVSGNSEVWVKLLKGTTGSEYAVLFFNRANSGAVNISATTANISAVGGDIANGKTYNVRDLWRHTDAGTWTAGNNLTSPRIGVNDVYFVRLSLPVSILPPVASVKVKDMRVRSEGERLVIHTARSGSQSVNLVNVKGVVVYSKHFTGPRDFSISTTCIPRGLYFVKVQTANERFLQKVILK
jgi:alpha-galactosidase